MNANGLNSKDKLGSLVLEKEKFEFKQPGKCWPRLRHLATLEPRLQYMWCPYEPRVTELVIEIKFGLIFRRMGIMSTSQSIKVNK